MEIYGEDIIIETSSWNFSRALLLTIADKIEDLYYPHVVREDCGDEEMFLYKNQAAKDSWEEHGRTDENAKDMYHLIVREGDLTVVTEDEELLNRWISQNNLLGIEIDVDKGTNRGRLSVDEMIRQARLCEMEKEYECAEEFLEEACRICPDKLNHWGIHLDLASLKVCLKKYEEAEKHFQLAEDLAETDKEIAVIYHNKGWMYRKMGRIKDAISAYEVSIDKDPEEKHQSLNGLGVALMLEGKRKEGLEKREQSKQRIKESWKEYSRMWNGEPFEDKILLVYNMEGRGDAIQNVRYLPLVKELGGTVVLEVRQELAELFSCLSGVDLIIQRPPTFGSFTQLKETDYDLIVSINSLEHLFYPKIPNEPYIVAKKSYKEEVPVNDIKVGFAWAGSFRHYEDDIRSIYASLFRRLDIDGVSLFSLQKDPETHPELYDHGFYHDLNEEMTDYTETAKFVDYVDLVITVDTSIAHLAGAMGKPVWLLLPPVPDCRWTMQGNTTDLYPSMMLIRQENDWKTTFDSMANVLRRWRDQSQG
jgi:tetratricopeptide (TPR) repeat protein